MWGLIDCDNFFCSCERVFRPDLNGRAMVVLSNNDGCVVARSSEAKSLGVKMGMPYFKMLEEFAGSGIKAFSSNYELYADMSARVMAVIREEAPTVYQYSIDEAFVDLGGIEKAKLREWGISAVEKVRKWTGMPVSIGIAPTKTLAKIAVRYAKKYAGYKKCCLIADDIQRLKALENISVGDVWGIGRRIAASLEQAGITTAAKFASRPKEWVRKRYHVTGERTWLELNGINATDISEMEVERKSIMTSRSFPEMFTKLDDLAVHVANYAARCGEKLRKQHSLCGMVTVFVQSNYFRDDLEQYSASSSIVFPTATDSSSELVEASRRILAHIYKKGVFYKRAGVMVSDISSSDCIQPDLFYFDAERREKYARLSEIIDEINQRLGADTVILAAQQYPAKANDGKNLKFAQAIKRAMKSPAYSTHTDAFRIK